METLGKFCYTILVSIACMLWGGFVLSTIWGWFITPLGIPAISAVQGAGIMIGFDVLRYGVKEKDKQKDDEFCDNLFAEMTSTLFRYVSGTGFLYGFGWLLSQLL